jgi:hypothetical protein
MRIKKRTIRVFIVANRDFTFLLLIKNYHSASVPRRSVIDLPSRCNLHRSSQNILLCCKGYILRILLKILISKDSIVLKLTKIVKILDLCIRNIFII